jgi:hypothetical protein
VPFPQVDLALWGIPAIPNGNRYCRRGTFFLVCILYIRQHI